MNINFDYLRRLPVLGRVLITVMIITVLSFFVQSALPAEVSSAESGKVSDILEIIIPSDSMLGRFVHSNIRKIGHFVEYGAFGAEAALFVFFFIKRKLTGAFGFSASALFTAFCDETLQIFSGRGPAIADVWIDFFGFLSLFFLTYGAAFVLHNMMRKNK